MIFLLAGDGAMAYVRFGASRSEVAANAASMYTVVFMCLLIGGVLAFWLRRFGLLFPGWLAILSLLWVGGLGLL
jgi:hypothetical protein